MVTRAWAEILIAVNEDIVACERRFHQQCILVADAAEHMQVTAEDELKLASYRTSLVLLRAFRDEILSDVRYDA